jgi:RNA polymerase sigma-70 factor, ECF subfamily
MTKASNSAQPATAEGAGPEEASGVSSATIPFSRLVLDHLDFVWRSLRRFGVPSAELDDATQQVFLVANGKLALIRPGSERSFLISVATKVASNARRAHQRRENAQQVLSQNPAAVVADPEQLAQRLEARTLLDGVLDKMPPELRSVFVLFELEELSVDEVAEMLGLPRGTAATRLRRARILFHEEAKLLQGPRPGGLK